MDHKKTTFTGDDFLRGYPYYGNDSASLKSCIIGNLDLSGFTALSFYAYAYNTKDAQPWVSPILGWIFSR